MPKQGGDVLWQSSTTFDTLPTFGTAWFAEHELSDLAGARSAVSGVRRAGKPRSPPLTI